MKRKGSPILGLIIGILILAFAFIQMNSTRSTVPPDNFTGPVTQGKMAIDQSFEAVCGINKAAIQNALQMYNLNHEPMKTLDLQALAGLMRLPEKTPNNPCKYALDAKGNVVCEAHP